MNLQPSPEQKIIGCSLSNYLADRRRQILDEWIARVLRDKDVPAANQQSLVQLEDHIPQILDDLSRALDEAFSQQIKDRIAWRAGIHGRIRWQQNYNMPQIIREISDLRTVLICHLAEFNDKRMPDLNGELGVFATVVLHSFFDLLILFAVDQYHASAKNFSPPEKV
jgi:hypothetical protein